MQENDEFQSKKVRNVTATVFNMPKGLKSILLALGS